MQPRDQLFATLDVTAHAGSLPSRIPVLYMDTIGFLSQLPHSLIQSFSATLEDVAHSVRICMGQVSSGTGHCVGMFLRKWALPVPRPPVSHPRGPSAWG